MSAKAKAYLAPPSYWSPVSAPGTTYAPVYSAPGVGAPGVPGVPVPKGIPLPRPVVTLQVPPPKAAPQRTEAAILDLKDQIGSLRKDLSNVRENVDEQLRRSEEQEEELARALRQRMNSLCSELADCGIEALKLCANLGHRPYGEAILRSRSAPGGRFWRASAPAGPAPTPRLSGGAAPAARLFTGPPAVCGGSATAPQIHTAPWMTPLPGAGPAPGVPGAAGGTAPIPQLGLSPRRPAPAPRMAWTEPVTALQHTARAVTASGTSLTPSASSCNVLLRPPQPSASQPLSPKETLTLPGRLPSPNGRYLHRPFDQDSVSNAKAGDSSLKSSAENLLKLEDSVGDSTLGAAGAGYGARPRGPQGPQGPQGPRVQLPMADLPPEVLRRLRKTAGSPRARKLREQLAAHREAKEAARQRSRSVSAGRESKAMVPLREGSPLGQAAQWHKPGRIHSAMKEPPAGAWSPRRPSRHWTVPNATPRTRRVTQ